MKKLSRIFAMTMALALTFGMTALAAPSVSTTNPSVNSDVLAEQAAATTANVGSTSVTVAAADVATYDAAVAATETAVVGDVTVKAVAAVVEITATIPAGETANITINNSAIDASKKYVVLHQKADGTWESVPVVAISAGAITATFSSLSPVAIVEVEAKAGSASSAPAAAATPAASPKTGETASVALIAMMVCLCGAAVVATKRAKAN